MTTNPPDGWEVTSGTWGTDIDQQGTTVETGDYSLHFLNTTPGADPAVRTTDFIPVRPSHWYQLEVRYQVSAASASEIFRAKIEWYDESEVLQSTDTFNTSAAGATGVWKSVGQAIQSDAGARLAKVILEKDNTAFHAYADRVSFQEFGPFWYAERDDGGLSVATSTTTTVTYNATVLQDCSESGGVITLDRGGDYSIDCIIEYPSIASAKQSQLGLRYNGGTVYPMGAGVQGGATAVMWHAGHFTWIGATAGNTFEMRAFHDDTAEAVRAYFIGRRLASAS